MKTNTATLLPLVAGLLLMAACAHDGTLISVNTVGTSAV